MAQVVASYQQSAFSTPINGATADASVVLANDNNLRTAYNNHDADGGVHLQSSTLASRPAASVAGRKWFTTDGLRLYFDTGSVWSEAAYLPLVGGTMSNTTVVASLNADLLDGQEGAFYRDAGNINAGTLPIARGGLGITTTPSNGFIPIGNGTGYVAAAITQGAGITVTNGGGTITIAVAGGTPNTGSGTTNRIVKYTGTNTQGNADMIDAGAGTITSGSVFAPRGLAMTVVTPTYGTNITVDLSAGSVFKIEGNASTTSPVTLGSPGTGVAGQIIHFFFKNTSGGVNLSVLWNAIYKGTPIATVSFGKVAAVSYISDGTNWIPLNSADGGY